MIWSLTYLQNVFNASGFENFEPFVKGKVVRLAVDRTGPAEARVHADVPFISREGPKDDPPLNRFRDTFISLLYPLEGYQLSNDTCTDIQQCVGPGTQPHEAQAFRPAHDGRLLATDPPLYPSPPPSSPPQHPISPTPPLPNHIVKKYRNPLSNHIRGIKFMNQ